MGQPIFSSLSAPPKPIIYLVTGRQLDVNMNQTVRSINGTLPSFIFPYSLLHFYLFSSLLSHETEANVQITFMSNIYLLLSCVKCIGLHKTTIKHLSIY